MALGRGSVVGSGVITVGPGEEVPGVPVAEGEATGAGVWATAPVTAGVEVAGRAATVPSNSSELASVAACEGTWGGVTETGIVAAPVSLGCVLAIVGVVSPSADVAAELTGWDGLPGGRVNAQMPSAQTMASTTMVVAARRLSMSTPEDHVRR